MTTVRRLPLAESAVDKAVDKVERSGWVSTCVSVVVPARNESAGIGRLVTMVLDQREPGLEVEVIVVDDNSTDDTAGAARASGATVIRLGPELAGNPAAARNRGARASRGDPIIFLDADCTPAPGWLRGFLKAHASGETIVGGALDLPPGLSASARCDYYCGWYLVHSKRPAGHVPHHPPPNLSVRREPFLSTAGFTEHQPYAYTNEERAWQAELQRRGHRIYFAPLALAYHHNRPGFLNLLRRNYRWAYTAIPSKATSGSARMAWMYRYPKLMIAASVPLAFAHTGYVVGCWVRAGTFEPVAMLPAILASRFAYVAGMAVGGVQWLRRGSDPDAVFTPHWQ
ncbi:MAG: glycosyltransferase [Gemmatimonadetes bacterium]|nr:glycosyltransferase [Gemmatimonadota bacterium]